ncbi:GAF sensor signal transduction histidine kinase [Salinisphaera hydrothermalis C41B8]|uniref:histidine kinase n=2 Tax=Salinisphaera TaxID=180541 RepID=A0A084ILI4_SALHC|nr:GAF sensor signal transduction histidine kinase [Salinisphaera hydrothermalis C41B8]
MIGIGVTALMPLDHRIAMTNSYADGSSLPVAGDDPGFAERALDLLLSRDTSLALCGLTLDGRIRRWHDSAERLLGHFASDVIGRRLDYLAPAEYRHQGVVTRTLFGASAAGHTQLDLPLIARAGARKTCRLDIRPQAEAEPGFAVLVQEIGAGCDAPSRARGPRNTRAAHRANLALIGGEPGWIGLGLEAEVRHVSPQAAQCLGIGDRDWVGRPLSDLLRPTEDEDWYRLLHRAVETDRPQQSLVIPATRQASDICWPATLVALYDEAGDALMGFTLALGDAEKSADRRTAPMTDVAQSPERAWFNAVVHDLREPLRRVRGYVEVLRRDEAPTLGAQANDYLARIDTAIARLQDNVGGVLRLARLDQTPFVPERVELEAVIDAVLDDLETLVRDHGARIDISALGAVSGDPVQLRLLFQNLIDNSIRYRRPDVPPRIAIMRLDGDSDDGMLRLRYTDNARGFERGDAELVRSQPDKVEGTGIGLDLCRRIARRHRGDLEIAETHGQGTTFIIKLARDTDSGATQSLETE